MHLELFPPNYNFTPVFEFTPMGFGYYVRIIPITYIATDIFFPSCGQRYAMGYCV